MNASELRNDFHKLIDSFTDIKLLEELYEVFSEYKNRKPSIDIIDQLTAAQQTRLSESIKQADSNKTISHEEVKATVKTWLTK